MSELLKDIWYFAALSREVKPGSLQRKELVGEPVSLGRTQDGQAFALRDICPHRAAPLSAGRIVNHPEDGGPSVECPYHGWRFKTSNGACAAIPSLVESQSLETERIKVRRFPVVERDGLIWIYIAADKRFDGEPDLPAPTLPVPVGAPQLVERAMFDCHIDHAVVGLMDPAHGPYVHRQWWWRSEASVHEKAKAFGPSEHGFTMLAHKPSSNSYAYKLFGGAPTTEIAFRLPGIRTETIRNDKHVVLGFTAVTPLNPTATEITQVFFWDHPLLSAIKPLIRPAARAFLKQDGDMVNLQQSGLRYDPTLMLIDDADVQAKWYHRLKREWTASREERRPFQNPIEPVTLRWRS